MASQLGQIAAAARSVEITPPVGVKFDGYGARTQPSNDIHDPLYATLLVLKTRDTGVAIVACDLLAVPLGLTRRIRSKLSPILEIPQENILVSTSHTHAGPAGIIGRIPPLSNQEDPYLQEMVLQQLAGAARWASRHLQPARLGAGHGEVREIGRNRNDPVAGLTDYEVTVLRVDSEAGQPLAILVNYGCHPTVLGPENLSISADYPGAARSALGKLLPGTVFLFTNGATGDVSTRFTRRGQGFGEVERMGQILAGEALKVVHTITTSSEATLSACIQPVTLPFRQFPPVEAAQQRLVELEAELAHQRAAGLPHGEIRKAVTKVEGAQIQLIMAQTFAGVTSVETEIQVLRLGPLAVVGLPGEPFTRTVLELKAKSPIHPAIVVSYANDYRGYFPDAWSIEARTYEALTSPYDASVGEKLAREALALLG